MGAGIGRHRGLYILHSVRGVYPRHGGRKGEGKKKPVFICDADVSRRVVRSRNAVAASRRAATTLHVTHYILYYYYYYYYYL